MTPATRDKILETAARLFHEQGYGATGVSTILREAGVHSGSLYHHFQSKDDLLLAVLDWYIHGLRPFVMDPAEAATPDPIERVFALLRQYREGLAQSACAMGCPIGNLALEVGDSHAQARVIIDQNFKNWSAVVRGWLESAGDRLPSWVNRADLADLVLVVMEGGIMLCRARGSIEPFDGAVAQLRGYFDLLQGAAGAERESARGPRPG